VPTKLSAILIDLDDTLYPPECGLLGAGDRRIAEFISRRLGLDLEEADALRRRLWRAYGTTARGLAVEHGIPAEEMCAEALESMDMASYLRPDPKLAEELRGLGVRLVLFTNSTRAYAEKVLEALGLRGVFEAILDIHFLAWEGKPSPKAFVQAMEFLGLDPSEVAVVDDNPPNLLAARQLGMTAVAVGPDAAEAGDIAIPGVHGLGPALRRHGLL
jgi:putative hydrolase of the HAD superfamily